MTLKRSSDSALLFMQGSVGDANNSFDFWVDIYPKSNIWFDLNQRPSQVVMLSNPDGLFTYQTIHSNIGYVAEPQPQVLSKAGGNREVGSEASMSARILRLQVTEVLTWTVKARGTQKSKQSW